MKFGGRADVRGYLTKISTSFARSKKTVEEPNSQDEEVNTLTFP
jgi:hypothetical protein